MNPDPLRLDPALSEQLDKLSAQISEERDGEIASALMEMGIRREELGDIPDVKVIDTETYDDDPAPVIEHRPHRIPKRRIDGHVVSHPDATLDTRTMQLVGPIKPPVVDARKEAKAVERMKANKAKRWATEQKELDRLYNGFIESLAQEEELKQALALSDSPKAEAFLKDLSDPRYNRQKWTVSALAYKNGLKASELATIFRNFKLAEGSRVAISAIPAVMRDIVEDAKSGSEVCQRCDGLKIIERRIPESVSDPETGETITNERVEWLDCPNCGGTGAVRKPGSSDARKIMTEMAGYTGKKGPLVQQTFVNNHNMAAVVEELEDFGNAPIIDSTLAD